MRLSLALLGALVLFWAPPEAEPAAPPTTEEAEDLLGELMAEAKKSRGQLLPEIAVQLGGVGDLATATHEIVRRDLSLSGQFRIARDPVPEAFDQPFEPRPFAARKIEAVVRVSARATLDGGVELLLHLFLPQVGDQSVLTINRSVSLEDRRLETHRMVDEVLGALTGIDGPFASRLILVRTENRHRRAYLIDPDGANLIPLSPEEQLVVTAALDPDANPYWSASIENGRYRLFSGAAPKKPIDTQPTGSVYGIAFSPDGKKAALTIADRDSVGLWVGAADFTGLLRIGTAGSAMHPAFARERLVWASATKRVPRIVVDSRPISSGKLAASSPAVCNHFEGARVVYEVGVGKRSDIVASDLDGSNPLRLTKGQGRNSYPACSPDGRLVAFFSTRRGGDGPGLYLMRTDGRRVRKISATPGDSLHWVRIPRRPPTKP